MDARWTAIALCVTAAVMTPRARAQDDEVTLEAALLRIAAWEQDVHRTRAELAERYDFPAPRRKTLREAFVRRNVGFALRYVDDWAGVLFSDLDRAGGLYGRHAENAMFEDPSMRILHELGRKGEAVEQLERLITLVAEGKQRRRGRTIYDEGGSREEVLRGLRSDRRSRGVIRRRAIDRSR